MRVWLFTSAGGGTRRLVLGVEALLLMTLALLVVQAAQTYLSA